MVSVGALSATAQSYSLLSLLKIFWAIFWAKVRLVVTSYALTHFDPRRRHRRSAFARVGRFAALRVATRRAMRPTVCGGGADARRAPIHTGDGGCSLCLFYFQRCAKSVAAAASCGELCSSLSFFAADNRSGESLSVFFSSWRRLYLAVPAPSMQHTQYDNETQLVVAKKAHRLQNN